MTPPAPAKFYTTERYARLIARCQDYPCTAYDAADFLGITHTPANKYLKHAHKVGTLRICGWKPARRAGCPQACYGPADGRPDAPRPTPRSNIENVKAYQKTEKGRASVRRYKARRKLDPEQMMKDQFDNAARYARTKPMPGAMSLFDQLNAMVK